MCVMDLIKTKMKEEWMTVEREREREGEAEKHERRDEGSKW